MSITTLLAIGSGGFIGAVLRYITNNTLSHHLPHQFPYGILIINLFGSFLMGVIFALFITATFLTHSPKLYSFLTAGILGAFTTYSTFAIESFVLFESGHVGLAIFNIVLNSLGSVMFAGLGYLLVKQLTL